MLTNFIFISCSTFYSKILPFIELVLKTWSNFLLFYLYCSIVFITILCKKWGLEFLINLFLKGRAHNCTSSKTVIPGRVSLVGGLGHPHELYAPS